MTTTIKSAAAVKAAQDAKADALSRLFDAYEATAQDRAQDGVTDKAISDAWKALGVRPASVAMVGFYARAAVLTAHRSTFLSVVETVYGEGTMVDAHTIIARCQQARKTAHVDGILATLRKALAAIDPDATVEDREEATRKALTTAIRDLKAGAKPAKPNPNEGDEGDEGDESTDETDETVESDETDESDETPADPWTVALGMLDRAIAQVLHASGGALTEDQAADVRHSLLPLVAQVNARKTA